MNLSSFSYLENDFDINLIDEHLQIRFSAIAVFRCIRFTFAAIAQVFSE
jgi:hypothetical protein